MFFAFGLIGFLFACLAPGYIAIAVLGLRSRLPPFAGPFAISLILNNLLVEALAASGHYTQGLLLPLASLVVCAGAILLFFDKRLSLARLAASAHFIAMTLGELGGPKQTRRVLIRGCVLAIGFLSLAAICRLAPQYLGGTILGFDPTVSWNHWALQWASNKFAHGIAHYPQMIPILWSIPYVTAGDSSIQFFSSSFKVLFWIGSFETLAFIAWRRGQLLLLLSIGFLAFLFRYWGGATSLEDYVDVPVAFFSLLSVAVIIANESKASETVTVTLALILAGGAAMTKQVGLYMLAATPLLVTMLAWERHHSLAPVRRAVLSILPGLLLACLAAAPIYIYAVETIRNGSNTSELSYILSEEFGGQGYAARMGHAFWLLFNRNLLRVGSTLIVLASLASLRDREFRWVFLIIAVPYLLLWAANFSYDTRNLTLAMPFWALCAAAGLAQLAGPRKAPRAQIVEPATWQWLESKPVLNAYSVPLLLLTLIGAAAFAGAAKMPHHAMLARQQLLERNRLGGQPECTEKMISLLRTFPASHRILSEWRWACTFHFNDPNYCTRIFPDTFFAGNGTFARFQGENLLVILNRSSLTSARKALLQQAGLKTAGYAACDDAEEFFVSHVPG